ncbi:MAG: AAA family ATPase, partial [Prevotella sp.]|nr:AAA family ATPase [Prevotella sp.]
HMTYKEKFAFSQIKRNILKTLDLLIIDEISMVRSDLLDAIDAVLRRFRNPLQPFGGVQLLMIGDLQQLTPVVTDEDAMLLNRYYATPYFFDSHALAQVSYVTIELKKVYRQQNETFLRILNHVRDGAVTADDLAALNARYEPNFVPPKDAGYIRLTTHNAMADHYNEQQLAAIEEPAFCFAAEIRGTFPEYSYPTSEQLVLKKGAQVMFVRNDASPAHQYYNGRIGQVKAIDDD